MGAEQSRRNATLTFMAKSPNEIYIDEFYGTHYAFELGETLQQAYGLDDSKAREEMYGEITLFQQKIGRPVDEALMKSILDKEMLKTYFHVKERYLPEVLIGDSYDHDCWRYYFKAEATAARAYLLIVMQYIYAKFVLEGSPIPKQFRDELVRYIKWPRDNSHDEYDGYESIQRRERKHLMEFDNSYTGDINE